jgi:hypothetical protein
MVGAKLRKFQVKVGYSVSRARSDELVWRAAIGPVVVVALIFSFCGSRSPEATYYLAKRLTTWRSDLPPAEATYHLPKRLTPWRCNLHWRRGQRELVGHMTDLDQGLLRVIRILSAIILIAAGAIHLLLVFDGTGGVLGVLFVLNAIAGIILGVGMLALRARLLLLTSGLGVLFIAASFFALLLALTVGLFGIAAIWSLPWVPQTFVIEGVGVGVLAVTFGLALRARRKA